MSRMREFWTPPPPTGSVWKASECRLVGHPSQPKYVEAAPDATWAKIDPFRYYKPFVDRTEADNIPPPHKPFAALAEMARIVSSPKQRTLEKTKKFGDQVRTFADVYGFLGFFGEAFGPHVPPHRVDELSSYVAPDVFVDQGGRLREIDPATEGKRLLENLLDNRWRRFEGPAQRRQVTLARHGVSAVSWPNELRFLSLALDGGEFGLIRPTFGQQRLRVRRYEEVWERFGIRFVLDEHADAGVSIIATREPLDFWRRELQTFRTVAGDPAYFDGRTLEGVSPRAVADESGGLASSWRCPSLLKAIYLMIYLDETTGVRLQKCQAAGCPEYYRVGPRSRESLYCPPPPGREQSRCASRASSRMHRERQRRNPDIH